MDPRDKFLMGLGIVPSELDIKTDDETLSGVKKRREDRAELPSTKAHRSDAGAHARENIKVHI